MVAGKCACQESLDEDCKDENKDSTQKEQDDDEDDYEEEEDDDDLDDFDVDYHHLIHATAKELAAKFKLIVSNTVEALKENKLTSNLKTL